MCLVSTLRLAFKQSLNSGRVYKQRLNVCDPSPTPAGDVRVDFEQYVSDEDGDLSEGGAAGGEDGAKKSARQSGGGAEGSGGGGKKCWSPGVVEDISEASEMDEGVLEEDPAAAMIFGNPKNEQRGCGTGRNGRGKRTSAENAGQSDRCKEDKEREMEKRRASSTEGELGKGISLR
ncbi:hypothetical protein KUCAC02_002097 [Chaenocephalus aceratus]|uniref:Uncharacterized protein n=1 Tax=Chaenocephalus aceratus TaxID=36190 RepID=A0ACB9XSN5_CHAAC|nr:hypothetical protein KUCAC02_002097 [Chaenocephalus aceratus]